MYLMILCKSLLFLDKYEFNLQEGLELSPELEADFTAIAKDAKLTQEQATKLIDLHSKVVLDVMHKQEEIVDGWTAECQKQGLISRENIAAAKLAVNTFGGGEAMQVLVNTGVANHPAIQKMLQNIEACLWKTNRLMGKHLNLRNWTTPSCFPRRRVQIKILRSGK